MSLNFHSRGLHEDMIEMELTDESDEDSDEDYNGSDDAETPPPAPRKPKNYNSLPDLLLQSEVISNHSSASSHSKKSSSSLPSILKDTRTVKLGQATFEEIEEEIVSPKTPKGYNQTFNNKAVSNESLDNTYTAAMFRNKTNQQSPRSSQKRSKESKFSFQQMPRRSSREMQPLHLSEQNISLDVSQLSARETPRMQNMASNFSFSPRNLKSNESGGGTWRERSEKARYQIQNRLLGRQTNYYHWE